MLAFSLTDYINPMRFPWQTPLLLGAMLAWLLAAPLLLRWQLRRKNLLGKLKFRNMVIDMVVAGLGAIFVGGAIFSLIITIGKAREEPVSLTMPAAIMTLPLALITAYVVLFAMLNLPFKKVLVVGALPLVCTIAGGAGAVALCAFPVAGVLQEQRNQEMCLNNLRSISDRLRFLRPPQELAGAVDGKTLMEEQLLCPSASEAVSYYYLPTWSVRNATSEGNKELRLCDLHPHQGGKSRNVAFRDCRARTVSDDEFKALLALPENEAFAKGLAEAEKKNPD